MATRKIQPPFLRIGDEVAIISPSFCIDGKLLTEAALFLENWGLKVRLGENATGRSGPFAGTDEDRLADIQQMTDDENIKAVFCSRGGYGLSRIINRIDFTALKKAPKWYIGFSDITVLHIWLNEVVGIMSLHGEMPLNFNNTEKTPETISSLREALFGKLIQHEWEGNGYNQQEVNGELTGGNLSLLCSLIGTEAEPVTKKKILFLEDVGEYYYHIDRMLTSLKLSGKLEDLSALIIGGMNKMEDIKIPWGKSIEETIVNIAGDYGYPVLFNFPAGHISDNRSIYIGKRVQIKSEGNRNTLIFI